MRSRRPVLAKSTWAVLALDLSLSSSSCWRTTASIDKDAEVSGTPGRMCLFHWREEAQHAIIDEMEWRREHAKPFPPAQLDQAVTDLIELVGAADGLPQLQARADADHFIRVCEGSISEDEAKRILAGVLAAYRWQYIVSGVREPRFSQALNGMITGSQAKRIGDALRLIM